MLACCGRPRRHLPKQDNLDDFLRGVAEGKVKETKFLHERDDDGYNALICAAEEGHDDLVNHFIEQGARLEDADNLGRTPLYAAAVADHPEVVETLLRAGADPNCFDYEGRSAFWAACAVRSSCVDYFFPFVNVDAKDPACGLTAREFAQHRGHATILQKIDQYLSTRDDEEEIKQG